MIIVSIFTIIKTILFITYTNAVHSPGLVFITSSLISVGIIALLSSLNKSRRKFYVAIFYTLISIIMFVDVVYYSFFNTLPSVQMLDMVDMLSNVSNSVESLISKRSLLFLIDLPFVYYYLFKKKNKTFEKRQKLIISGVTLVSSICILLFANYNSFFNTLKYQEFYTYHLSDIISNTSEQDLNIETTMYTEDDIISLQERSKLIQGPNTGVGKDKNLIVIQVEALQNFVINLEYNNQEITPNLNMLIEDSGSIYYDNYFQLLGRGNTSDAEFVTNNSLHPSMESPTYTQYEDNTFYGLPWLLRDEGYTSWVFHGYEKEFWNRENAYDNLGFERFLSQDDYEVGDVIELGITDGDFYNQSIEYLKELDQIDDNPFYAFIISLSSHNPFTMPDDYKEIDLLNEHENTILGDYLNSIHYADKALGEFLNNLKSEGLYDDTVFAIYGDHFAIPNSSQEVIDMMKDFLGTKYNFDYIMNVPLIINVPNTTIGYTNNKIGSAIDFYPTILNILGLENQKGLMFGRDLENFEGYNNVKPQTVMRKGSFIDDEVIFQMASTELFENSKVENRKTLEQYELDDYREKYEEVIREINFSNYILRNDLLKPLLETGTAISEDQNILTIMDTKIEIPVYHTLSELENIYEKRGDIIAVDISQNNEDRVIIDNEDQNTGEELVNWSEDKENIKFLLRTKEDFGNEFYNKLRYQIPRSKTEDIIEIDTFDKYYFVQSYGFENIMLDNTENTYSEQQIKDFLNAHKVYGVVIEPSVTSPELIEEIYKHQTLVFDKTSHRYNIVK